MSKQSDIYEAHQRARFTRHDAARFMRPDAARWIRPDVARFLKPRTNPADVFIALKYSPTQRRIPAGRTGGGRWTDATEGGGGSGGGICSGMPFDAGAGSDQLYFSQGESETLGFGDETPSSVIDSIDWTNGHVANEPEDSQRVEVTRIADGGAPILNEFGEPYYRSGGHHEFPKRIYESWDLSPETRQVFQRSTTGRLPIGYVSGPEGETRGHYWDNFHREYTDAVTELSNRFLKENDIMETRRMTPDQAMDLLAEIRSSEEPTIRNYNRAMRYISRIFRLGSGRGNQ